MAASDNKRHVESFRTHANYLSAFALLCRAPYQQSPKSFFSPLQQQLDDLARAYPATQKRQPPPTSKPDLRQVQASLANAWGTELLLALGGTLATEEELIRLMNNWAVVQTYYVGYHAIQALLVARGGPRPESHPKTQAQFAALWADRRVNLPPCTLGAFRDGWRNPPPQGVDDSISPWSSCDERSCWNLAGKALRTTRQAAVADRLASARKEKSSRRRKDWMAKEQVRQKAGDRPRKEPTWSQAQLTFEERRHISDGVRTYTILDYLYRLRIKCNYEDAGMFIDGPASNGASLGVKGDLATIASCMLLIHELSIASALGKEKLVGWVDDWLRANTSGRSIGLALRRDLIAEVADQ